jgi:adenine-specific DNA-methyltransferase
MSEQDKTQNTAMPGESLDIAAQRRAELKQLFPGKRDCLKLIQQPSRATLKPCREESVDFDTTQNLFIEGDNLEVLKLLQKSYYGRIKMIYIDPPYNTGKEFIYPDNYSESLETYLAYAGLIDAEGKKFSTNTANEGRFHTKWLNMMYPRLYLARNLLKEDGAIFISIDDHEVENLRRMCDEIFGEENFIASVVWHKMDSPKNSARYLSEDHDYILLYVKNSESWRPNLLPRSEKMKERYQNPDNDPRGPWLLSDLAARNYYGKGMYSITTPKGRVIEGPPAGSYWRISKEKFDELDKDNRIWWGESGDNRPGIKKFLSEVKDGVVPQTYWPWKEVGSTRNAKQELSRLMNADAGDELFLTPKPTKLIKRMLQISTEPSKEDIILDFFAGSGSTYDAVISLNAEGGGNRRCILVQLPEKTEKYSTIANMGKERLRRAIEREKSRSEGEFEFKDNSVMDLGFKVLKLDQSNFTQWRPLATDISDDQLKEQLELQVDHLDPQAQKEAILYELLLKSGIQPTRKIESAQLAGHEVSLVEDGHLIVCLEDWISRELIDAVVEHKPQTFICLDKAFHGNDQLKANAVETFAAHNEGLEIIDRIEFRTV